MQFSYTAATKEGTMTTGVIEASSRKSAVAHLERDRLVAVRVKMVSPGGHLGLIGQIPLQQRMLMAQHLATMLSAGVSLLEALRVIGEEAKSRWQRKILARVLEKVSGGTTLAASLEAQGRAFDPLFVNLIRVGESSGTLEENLRYLSDELEKRLNLKSKIRSAIAYPLVVVFATVVLGVILVYFVLPKIVPLFTSLKITLPWTTRMLLVVATFVRQSGFLSLAVVVAVAIALRVAVTVPSVRTRWHRSFVFLPVFGRIVRSLNLANFCRTLGTLIKSGVPLLEALGISAETSRNVAYRNEIMRLRDAVASGQSLAAAIATRSSRAFFPPITLSLIRVGESSGKLDESLLYLDRYYEREVDFLMKDLAVILEPLLLVGIGLSVAFVAGSIIMPIYQISGSLRIK